MRLPTTGLPSVGPLPGGTPASRPALPSTSVDLRARYPLRLAEAQGFAAAGYPVAGYFPNGEIRVQRLVGTEYQTQPASEQVCKDRWDSVEGAYRYSCRVETVYKRVPVQKNKFWVSGAGVSTVAYDTVHQAFANIAPTDYWCRLTSSSCR